MSRRSFPLISLLAALMALFGTSVAACGDSDSTASGTDTGSAVDAGQDTGSAMDTGQDTGSAMDTGQDSSLMMDSAQDTVSMSDTGGLDVVSTDGVAGDADAGDTLASDTSTPPACIDLDEATFDLPWAIPDEWTASTPTWLPPDGPCPASGLRADPVPFIAYQFCNEGSDAADFLFELLPDGDVVGAYLVVYDGDAIPADATQCLGSNEPLVGLAEVQLNVAAGQTVTVVATLGADGADTFTLVAGPPF